MANWKKKQAEAASARMRALEALKRNGELHSVHKSNEEVLRGAKRVRIDDNTLKLVKERRNNDRRKISSDLKVESNSSKVIVKKEEKKENKDKNILSNSTKTVGLLDGWSEIRTRSSTVGINYNLLYRHKPSGCCVDENFYSEIHKYVTNTGREIVDLSKLEDCNTSNGTKSIQAPDDSESRIYFWDTKSNKVSWTIKSLNDN